MSKTLKRCHHVDIVGIRCSEQAENSGFCFWHDKAAKTNPDIKSKLEAWGRAGKSMAGFSLHGTDLAGIKLVNPNLMGADLYHADLSGAHLFNVNMTGSSLMKATLNGANLNCANLTNANLLGAEFEKTKIENVTWGRHIPQETKGRNALKKGDRSSAMDFFLQAEEVYRNLRKVSESRGLFENAGNFFHREMTMRRFQMPFFSSKRLISKMVDLFSGYGEKPINVIVFSLILIVICAALYYATGISGSVGELRFNANVGFAENARVFFYCLYFSVVTFTTLGYGDISPIGWSRLVASSEAFMGSFILALFVVVFVKKMTR